MDWLERRWAAWFPDLDLRPSLRTMLVLLLMCTYWQFAARAPDAFVPTMTEWTGIGPPRFHLYLFSHLSALFWLMVVPLIAARLEGFRPTELGLGVRGAGREFRLVGALFLAFVPVLLWASQFDSFQAAYPRVPAARDQATLFLWFHLAYAVKWIAWEFFFRGYLLFTFRKEFGGAAVLISTVPFVLMHYGKPPLEMYSSIVAGFLLCWLTLRGRSIWPGVLLHWAVATTMELFATRWFWSLLR